MNTCVFCNKPDNLNTTFNIKLDADKSVEVHICDTHADDATPKTAREAYLSRQAALDDILAKAKALGFEITIGKEGLSHAVDTKPAKKVEVVAQEIEPANAIDTNKMNAILSSKRVVANAAGTGLGSYAGHSLGGEGSECLAGTVQPEVVQGACGSPLIIPAVKQDATGTTRVAVVRNNPSEFDRRFKNMAQLANADQTPSFVMGYDRATRNCPMCKGTGESRIKGGSGVCTGCNGSGFVSTY